MSTARFARSGRVRICMLMSLFIVLVMLIFIYHMSQQQLDETRAFRLRCEQNQEGLNIQLATLADAKLLAEKRVEELQGEKQRIQDDYEKQQESERTLQQKYDDEVGKYKLLDGKYSDLQSDLLSNKKQHTDDKNALLLQVQQLQQAKKHNEEAATWKHKYETLLKETEQKTRTLEASLNEFKAHCNYMSHSGQQLNKPADLLTAETTPARRSSPAQPAHSIEKPRNEKSFNEQVQVSQGLYKIGVAKPSQQSTTNATTKPNGVGVEQQMELRQQPLQPFDPRNNNSHIFHSVENFQIVQDQPVLAAVVAAVSPLSAPRKPNSSTPNSEVAPNASVAPKVVGSSSSSSTGQPPLAMPPAKPSAEAKAERKLPENVAPIPDNFDGKGEITADADTAAEELPKNENNNRYANVVNDLEANKNQGDSGAHEVKDALNEPNFNLPGANSNLFDNDLGAGHAAEADGKMLAADAAVVGGGGGGGGGDDDDDVMLGDVAVKQQQHLLDGENLNNEIAADQGKEFADGGVHLEDNLDDDQDEDDYNVPQQRKPGADAAVRN